MKITALMPIRTRSLRIKNKNTRPFNGKPLFTIMLDKLQQCDYIDKILVNTDSEIVKNYLQNHITKALIIERDESISADSITMNTLIDYDINFTAAEHFIQTHCTNPLLTLRTINKAIETYFNVLPDYDSLFSVNRVQCRTYTHNAEPINHETTVMEQTQHLKPVYVENSNLFLFSRTSFKNADNNRVGEKPYLFEMNSLEATDIDYEDDFLLAELLDRNRTLFPESL